jgi:hypothetical protein
MHQRMTTLERAFDLARSGRFAILTDLIRTLDREGYSVSQIQGPLLKRQLTALIQAARQPTARGREVGAPAREI